MLYSIFFGLISILATNGVYASEEVYGPNLQLVDDMVVELGGIPGSDNWVIEKWDNGVLPVRFDSSIAPDQRKQFMSACNEWSKKARVMCIEGSYLGRVVTVSQYSMGCWALWGKGSHFVIGLQRRINLEPKCWKHNTLIHEIGHAFGFVHEHQRADRDRYVKIVEENIADDYFLNARVNFGLQKQLDTQPYDFRSIMHYASDAFSKTGGDTIVPLHQYRGVIEFMGRATELSKGDGTKMAELYGSTDTSQ